MRTNFILIFFISLLIIACKDTKESQPAWSYQGEVDETSISDSLWGNQGTLTFEFKLNSKALSEKQVVIDCPVLKLELKNNALWPALIAAPQAKGERKERVQFAFFNPEQWYHLSIAWDGEKGKFRIYLNGEMQQPSYFNKWMENEFKGNLTLGNENITIQNVSLYDKHLNEQEILKLTSRLELKSLSGEGRRTFTGAMDLDEYETSLVYEADFCKSQVFVHENELFENGKRTKKPEGADWVLEGNATVRQESGAIVVRSSKEGDIAKNHAVLWNTTVFPENFLLEFEMTAKDAREGLGIIFFSSTAHKSNDDVFSLHLPKREGDFGRYMKGALDCYHTSYWASNMDKGSRESTNLRKNKGFKLVALGDEIIGRFAHENNDGSQSNTIRLLKIDGKIQLETRGQLVLSWQDDGNQMGDVLGPGQIGLRHMGHAREVSYSKFKVYEIMHR